MRVVRSPSAFGFSMINVIFEDAIDLYFARTRVLERLNCIQKLLPEGVVPPLGPDATGVGHVFWYTSKAPVTTSGSCGRSRTGSSATSSTRCRAWPRSRRRRLRPAVPGRRGSEPAARYASRSPRSSTPSGARTTTSAATSSRRTDMVIVRGLGLDQSSRATSRRSSSAPTSGTPIYVGAGRHGAASATPSGAASSSRTGREAVGGMVVARYGENTKRRHRAGQGADRRLQPGLPAGVAYVPSTTGRA